MKNTVYEMVTNRIIEQLEAGITANNWECPFSGLQSKSYNIISKRPYSLLNQLLLKHDGAYGTMAQWNQKGGKIRKGEKSEFCVFWKIYETEKVLEDGTKEKEQIPLLRYYHLFHESQVEGIQIEHYQPKEFEPIKEEKVLTDYIEREHITLTHTASNEAYYSPIRDLVHLPLKEQFLNANHYTATLSHELIHSTMLERRCNREADRKGKIVAFESEEYSLEECIAELGSAMILNKLGIETPKTFKNSTAYIHSWIQILKNDPRFIVSASSKAQTAVEYIFGEA